MQTNATRSRIAPMLLRPFLLAGMLAMLLPQPVFAEETAIQQTEAATSQTDTDQSPTASDGSFKPLTVMALGDSNLIAISSATDPASITRQVLFGCMSGKPAEKSLAVTVHFKTARPSAEIFDALKASQESGVSANGNIHALTFEYRPLDTRSGTFVARLDESAVADLLKTEDVTILLDLPARLGVLNPNLLLSEPIKD